MMRVQKSDDELSYFMAEDRLELITRSLVRKDLRTAIGDPQTVPDMQVLERVLFDIIYPCPAVP